MNCVCGMELVKDRGDPAAKILMVGEFPGMEEIRRGVVFTGKTGEILEYELALAGLRKYPLLLTNLALHNVIAEKGRMKCSQECWDFFSQTLREKMEGRYTLLMGSEFGRMLGLPSGVSDWSSLEVEPNVIVTINPASALHGGIGEFRLALQRFKEMIDERLD